MKFSTLFVFSILSIAVVMSVDKKLTAKIKKPLKVDIEGTTDGPTLICCLQKTNDQYNNEIKNADLIMWHFLPPPIPEALENLFETDMKPEMILPQWLIKEKFSDNGYHSCSFEITNFIDELYGKWSITTVYQIELDEEKYYQYRLDTVEFTK